MVKLTDKYRTEVALFRYGILAPLISGTWDGGSDHQFLCDQLKEFLKKYYILNEDDRIFKEYYVKIRDRLKKAQKRANLNEEFTLHSFRHSHVSLLIDLGYSPTIVADRIGDTVDTVLKTYSHLYAESKESLSEKLNNLYK